MTGAPRPNIILIMTDRQRSDTIGAPAAEPAPALDHLAAEGRPRPSRLHGGMSRGGPRRVEP